MSYLDYNEPYGPANKPAKPAKPKKSYSGSGSFDPPGGSDNYQRFLEYLENSSQAAAFRRKIIKKNVSGKLERAL